MKQVIKALIGRLVHSRPCYSSSFPLHSWGINEGYKSAFNIGPLDHLLVFNSESLQQTEILHQAEVGKKTPQKKEYIHTK